jgi:siroheme synthase (precorrin-2 oxidase/ferrochelatase)
MLPNSVIEKVRLEKEEREKQIQNFQKEEAAKERQIQKIKDLRCSWCDKSITNNEDDEYVFWQCKKCGYIFCYKCSHVKGDVPYSAAVKCKCQKEKLCDCIWDRKVLSLKEQEEDEL